LTELSATVQRLRAALAADPESLDYASLAAPARPEAVAGLPGGLGDVLALTDGPRCGAVICWPVAALPKNQFYCDDAGGTEDWLCFGVNSDDPLLVRRDTGVVWYHPETGYERTPESPFVQLADDVPSFFEEYVFGPGYLRIAYEDEWAALLRAQGLIPG